MSVKSAFSKRKKSASGKKKVMKEEAEDPALNQLRMLNEDLQKENMTLKESAAQYQHKLQVVIQYVLDFNVDNYSPGEESSLADIPESDITNMIKNLTIAPSGCIHGLEMQIEELETQLARSSAELAKLVRLKLKIERELKEMEKINTVEELRVAAKRIWYDSCSTRVLANKAQTNHVTDTNVFGQSSLSEISPNCLSTKEMEGKCFSLELQEPIPAHHLHVLNPRARSIVLTPKGSENEDLQLPEKKMPGETHIFDMHIGLRSLVIRELSKYRGNGSDWRLMAKRVGIPESLTDQWIKMQVPNSMALVMKVWGDSIGASVRMLHRHLISPQIKATVLAKRVSDFYDVD